MQSILQELFYGNINPNAKQFVKNSEYGKSLKTVCDCEEKLLTLLSGKELELFEKLMKAQGESSHINGREYFVEGFRLGAKIALEIMDKNDGCIIDIIGYAVVIFMPQQACRSAGRLASLCAFRIAFLALSKHQSRCPCKRRSACPVPFPMTPSC